MLRKGIPVLFFSGDQQFMHLLEFVFILLDWESLDIQLPLQSCCLVLKLLVVPWLREVRTHFTSAIDIYFQSWMNQNSESYLYLPEYWIFYLCLLTLHEITVCNEPPPPLLFYLHIQLRHTKSATAPPDLAGETWLHLLGIFFPPAFVVCPCVVPHCCRPDPAAGWGTDTSPPALQQEHAG